VSEPRVVQKAFAYVTRGREVLVLLQPDFPEVGLQVPAGTVEPGESPERAVLREAHEETGLGPFSAGEFLGQREFDARLYGKPEIHERHFYHLVAPGSPPSRLRHFERHSGGNRPVAFDLFWLPIEQAAARLSYELGALLGVLAERLTRQL
jgi:8-oxo-dGTP diphosphatase